MLYYRTATLLGKTYSLGRPDVPDILAATGYSDLDFVEQLVMGDWTSQSPECLRSRTASILAGVTTVGGHRATALLER